MVLHKVKVSSLHRKAFEFSHLWWFWKNRLLREVVHVCRHRETRELDNSFGEYGWHVISATIERRKITLPWHTVCRRKLFFFHCSGDNVSSIVQNCYPLDVCRIRLLPLTRDQSSISSGAFPCRHLTISSNWRNDADISKWLKPVGPNPPLSSTQLSVQGEPLALLMPHCKLLLSGCSMSFYPWNIYFCCYEIVLYLL